MYEYKRIFESNFITTTHSSLKIVRRFVEKESDPEGFRVGFGGSACVGLRIDGLRFRGEQRILTLRVDNGG